MAGYRQDIDKIKPYVPGKPIEQVKRELGLGEVFKLASNEVPFAPLHVRKAVTRELKNINRYPESGCFNLRQAIAKKIRVKSDQLVFGNGSDELITLALRSFVDKGDEVVIAQPTFLVYEIQALVQAANVIKVPLKNFRYDLGGMAKAVSPKTKAVIIANPDNPTGTYLSHDEIKIFLASIPRDVLVFFDEAYFEFAPKDFPRSKEFLEERGNIIFSRTFSKAYALAGLRVGYAVTSPDIAVILDKVREPFNVNRIAQVAALAALEDQTFLKRVLRFVEQEKEYFYCELQKLNIDFVVSAANFVLINWKKDVTDVCEYLLKEGVIVRGLQGWGLPQCFRVTAGRHNENKKFIDCLKKYINRKG